MYLALRALGIGDGEGDEVITTPLTWPATANVIVRAGARPVFCDVDRGDALPRSRRGRGRASRRARAPSCPCTTPAIRAISPRSRRSAREHGLRLVEDAAHATETRLADGRKVGSVGDITCFSFYANKNLAAGEGGMLTLRDEELAARITSLRLHGLTRDSWKRYEKKGPGAYDVLEPGYKLNLSDLHAGVALGQLHRIEEHHARRVAQAERYDEGLAGLAGHHAARPPPRRRPASTAGTSTSCASRARAPAPTATPTRRRSARRASARACTSCPCTT